jgi:hypothetical protein
MKTNPSKSRGILASALVIGAMLCSDLATADNQNLSGGEQSVLDQEKTAVEAKAVAPVDDTPPTLTVKPLPVAKAKFHRYTNLRSGQVKTQG